MSPIILFFLILYSNKIYGRERWTESQAWAWFNAQKPIVGTEFTTSNAANQLEMWQAETFDVDLIDKELSLGPKLGMNTMRIFIHDMAYTQDPAGFKNRLNTVLSILDKYGMTAVIVFFAWGPIGDPKIGKQPQPNPAQCNSVYLRTPSWNLLQEPKNWPNLEPYVKDVVGTFANDSRVLAWDLWNEPANEPNNTNLLLPMVFDWARSVNPIQPLTTPLWKNAYVGTDKYLPIEQLQINNSDVVSFHNYEPPARFEACIQTLQKLNRPLIATEYMARTLNSEFNNVLPVGKKYNIGMLAWGHVNGKTEWNMPWDSRSVSYVGLPPTVWFQDIFRQDGSPYLLEEAQITKRLNGCPLGYHSKVNNWTCYNAYDTPLSFSDVQAACKNFWSNVVTINNAFENTDLRSYVGSLTNCNSFYIGLSKPNNAWKWPNTTPYNNPAYRNWKNGYPTNDANANCVVLNKADGTWTNQDCSTPQCYICSY